MVTRALLPALLLALVVGGLAPAAALATWSHGGRVLPALDGTESTGATWVECPAANPIQGCFVGGWREGWYHSITHGAEDLPVFELEVPRPVPPRFAAGYVAVASPVSMDVRPSLHPPTRLQPIPVPRGERVGDEVFVEWDALELDAPETFQEYRLYHSLDGVTEWSLVASTSGTSVTLDAPAPCVGTLALRPVFLTGVGPWPLETTVFSANSTPIDGVFTDTDGDTHADACDTCPDLVDPAQQDHDGDGVGDACAPSGMPWIEVLATADPQAPRVQVSGPPGTAVHLATSPLRSPFVYDHACDGTITLVEDVATVSVPLTGGNWYLLAAPTGPAPLDWGRDSRSEQRPPETPACP